MSNWPTLSVYIGFIKVYRGSAKSRYIEQGLNNSCGDLELTWLKFSLEDAQILSMNGGEW